MSITVVLCLLASHAPAALDTWCAHVTNTGGWKTSIYFYNAGASSATATTARYGPDGSSVGQPVDVEVPPGTWAGPAAGDLAYEGSARLTSAADLQVRLSYQLENAQFACEFLLPGETSSGWMLPNPVQPWMDWTGIALVNPTDSTVSVTLEAWLGGGVVSSSTASLPARGQYVKMSDQIWPGVAYAGFDAVRVFSTVPIAAPLDITGNAANSNAIFFTGARIPGGGREPGSLVVADPTVGNLRCAPSGVFTQGSPAGEPGRWDVESQFTHTLNQSLAVMETEVTQGMWEKLRSADNSLPANPSAWKDASLPVEQVTWYEAVLFANRLSVQRKLTPCYYVDAGFTTPVTSGNYQTDAVYCDWGADGFRLPTEGEWEHFCRAGTTGPFSLAEPNYSASTYNLCQPPQTLSALSSAAWWCGNAASKTHACGTKAANPWGLKDAGGNVWEWCWDWYSATYPSEAAVDYRGAAPGAYRVTRGGCWMNEAQFLRSAFRFNTVPGYRVSGICGFRLVRALD